MKKKNIKEKIVEKKKIEKNNLEEVVVEDKKQSKFKELFNKPIVDVALIILIMIFGIFLHSSSLKINNITEDNKVYYLNESSLPYLFDMDSYYYARKTVEFVNNGIGKLKSTRSDDKLQTIISSENTAEYTNLLPAICAILYKFISIFINIDIYTFIVHMGPIFGSLCVIPIYLFLKKRTNRVGAIFGSILSITAASIFVNTNNGCFDTDLLLHVIPLTFVLTYIECITSKDIKKQGIWFLVSTLFFLLLMYTWDAYGVYYYLIVGVFFMLLFINLIKEKFNIKTIIKKEEIYSSFACLVLFTILALIVNKSIDTSMINSALKLIGLGGSSEVSNYPDASKYISELRSIPLFASQSKFNPFDTTSFGIINRLGGVLVVAAFILALSYLVFNSIAYFKKDKSKNEYFILACVFILWSFGTLISIRAGSRFVKIATIPVNVLAGYSIGLFYELLKKMKLSITGIIFIITILVSPVLGSIALANSFSPTINDSVVEMANYIKTNTDENDVIASWWDFGYYYEYQSERRCIGDGGIFNGRYFYYLANALITIDEKQSANIYKMLSYKGLDASLLLDEYLGDEDLSAHLMLELLSLDKDEAKKLLIEKNSLTEEQASKIVELTHPDLDYKIIFVVTENMRNMKTALSYYATYSGDEIKSFDVQSILNRMSYEDTKSEIFTHLYSNTDPVGRFSSNVWIIE